MTEQGPDIMTAMYPHGNSTAIKSRPANEDFPICWLTWAKSGAIQMWTAQRAFRARHAARSHLLLLYPHLLRDIGIRRDQIDLVLESSTQPRLGSKLAAAYAAYKMYDRSKKPAVGSFAKRLVRASSSGDKQIAWVALSPGFAQY